MLNAAVKQSFEMTPRRKKELIGKWVDEWQSWLRMVSRERLDYPSHANFLTEHNGGGFKQAVTRNPMAEKMDEAFGAMYKLDIKWHHAVWFKYVEKVENNIDCAKMMGTFGHKMNRQTFENHLKSGEAFLMGVFFEKNI